MNSKQDQNVVRARIATDIKKDAGNILKRLGLTHSAFINLSYRAVIEHAGIPFTLTIPNKTSRTAIAEGREKKKTSKTSVSQWRKSLNIE